MKNWKTTLAGTLAGLPLFLGGVGVHFGHLGAVSVDQAIGGLGALLLGFFAKDHNVTGGTTPQ